MSSSHGVRRPRKDSELQKRLDEALKQKDRPAPAGRHTERRFGR